MAKAVWNVTRTSDYNFLEKASLTSDIVSGIVFLMCYLTVGLFLRINNAA